MTPEQAPDGGRIGVQLATNAVVNRVRTGDAGAILASANAEFTRLSGAIADGLYQIFTNFARSSGQLSGPIAIIAAGAQVARTDPAGLWQFAAIINLNLAAVNALPLPALDGGYLAVQLLEAFRGGRKLPQELERGVMSSGFLLLTAMGLTLIVKDTLHLSGL